MMKKFLFFTTAFAVIWLMPKFVYSQCNSMPTNAAELANCNFEIALRFAPEHTQEVDDDGGSSLSGKSDYLTAIDYDGDWVCNNNWDNLSLNPNSQFNAVVYYSVVWTKTHWYIIYAYYHPRDWSNSIFDPEHENDLEGILAIVRRPGANEINLSAAVLEAGITVFHLDFYSYTTSNSSFTGDNESVDGTLHTSGGTHPKTSQEAKGHGCKAWPQIGFNEDGIVTYVSNAANNSEFPSSINDSNVKYALIDIFEGGGLWSRRNNSETFAEWGKFSGDNGAGSNKANAPWTWDDKNDGASYAGEFAEDPQHLVDHYFDSSFPISDCYQFHPYDCDYSFKVSQTTVCNNKTVSFEVERSDNLPVNNASVSWNYNGNLWECVSGCGSNSESIKLKAKSNFSFATTVSVTVNTIDCGTQSFSKTIFPGNNCATAAFHFEDDTGQPRNVFCPGEKIFMDGSASQNETSYYIDAWRRPIGSTGNFAWYAGLGWTQGQIATLNLTNEFAPTQFTPGYEYEIKLAVKNSTTGWTPVTRRFTVLQSCCKKPVDISYSCFQAKLSWSTALFGDEPSSYLVRVHWNDPDCCSGTGPHQSSQWTTTNTYFYLPFIHISNCFSVEIGAICGNGDIAWSDKVCSGCKKKFLMKESGETEEELAVETHVFPNPAKDVVNLSLVAERDLEVSVEVYDLQGRMVKQLAKQNIPDGNFSESLILDSSLSRGIYLVLFKTNYGVFQEKLLLQ